MPENSEPTPTPDELHERFRQALDRKQERRTTSTSADAGAGGPKASARTPGFRRQREFRRKSGG